MPETIQDLSESLKFVHGLGKDKVVLTTIDGFSFAVMPNGSSLIDVEKMLEPYRSEPRRIDAQVQVLDVQSFDSYIKRFFAGGATAEIDAPLLKGSIDDAEVTAYLDYHTAKRADWCKHTCTLISKKTPQWVAFKAVNDKPQSQDGFAKFVDRWGQWITEPKAARLSELVMALEGGTNQVWSSKKERKDGSYNIAVQSDNTFTVKIPEVLNLRIAPFYHSPDQEVLAKIWLNVKDGAPTFTLSIDNLEQIEYEALTDTFEVVRQTVGLSVLVGP